LQIKNIFHSLLDIFYPNICVACDTAMAGNEKYVCTTCLAGLPFTNFWHHNENPVSQIFWGRVPVENSASFVFFEKGSHFQKMLHQLKYKGKADLGIILGRLFGHKLKESPFSEVDIIIPVPLHNSRKRFRGYNQSEKIARGLGESLEKPVLPNLVRRTKATKTQTSKSRFDRWENVDGSFKITSPSRLKDKHILVVDDVVTTGATSEAMMQELIRVPGAKVSFVALAHA
jgi:ComF family protein